MCGLRFEERYGEIGHEFMHVHHKMPLSEIANHDNHAVNPLEDLVPVCPNCHAMLHRPQAGPSPSKNSASAWTKLGREPRSPGVSALI